jgi:hypothetical protein
VELHQLESSVAVRSLHHRIVHPHALKPHDAVHPASLDRPLTLQLESELDEELSRGREVVNHDPDVLHPLDSHVLDANPPRQAASGCAIRSQRAMGSAGTEQSPHRAEVDVLLAAVYGALRFASAPISPCFPRFASSGGLPGERRHHVIMSA